MFFCITLSYYVGVVIILSQDTKQLMSTNILRYTLTTLIDYTEIKKKGVLNDILNSQRTLSLKGRYKFKSIEISFHTSVI